MTIERVPFGRTGHDSLRTIFGGAALGRATEAEAERAFDLILRYGIDHLDTAASYGDSELRIAPFLRREGRERFFVATKTGKRSYADARDEIHLSLERLGTDHVDLLQLHNLVDQAEWDLALSPDGALRAAVEAREAGLVRFIGVTGHGTQAPRRHRESLLRFPFDSVLFPYNRPQLRDPAYAADVASLRSLCDERGVATQTIKAITLGPWPDPVPQRSTWYEPLTDQADIDTAVRYVLAQPGLFLNAPSDIGLLAKVLDAADRGGPAPSDADADALIARRAMTPLFV
ncbi:MAG: aldo/keto reductase [Candidatus Limnocylindrales bacterium]